MDGQSRTVKTLTLLAASMTCGAMMLGWLEPPLQTTPADRSRAGQAELFAEVRQSIDAVLADRQGHWSFVEIDTIEADARRRIMLAASREHSGFDFEIHPDGALHWPASKGPASKGPASKGPASNANGDGTRSIDDTALRIALYAGDPDSPIADSQWMTLRLLLAELSARRPDVGQALTVRVHGVHTDSDRDDPDALQSVEQLLLRTGMAG